MSRNAFALVAEHLWACDPPALRAVAEVALAHDLGEIRGLEARAGKPVEKSERATYRETPAGRVAVLPVRGVLFRYANLMTGYCPDRASSTGLLATDFQAAIDDPAIRGVVLLIDSPGGEVNGTGELAGLVRQGAAAKPVTAYVAHMGASAAYWIAAACDEVVLAETALVGSIGAVLSVARGDGDETLEFVSSVSPRKRPDLDTEEGRSLIQARVDAMGDAFVAAVARLRGVAPETVLADFGRGDVLMGAAAVEAGLADRVGTLESVVAEMGAGTFPGRDKRKHAAPAGGRETTGASAMFGLWKKKNGALALQSAAVDDGDEPASAELVASIQAAAAKAPAAGTAAPAEPSAETIRLREELAESRRENHRIKAEGVYEALRKDRKVIPAEKKSLVAALSMALGDDLARPVAKGGDSRFDTLVAGYKARLPHDLGAGDAIDAEAEAPGDAEVEAAGGRPVASERVPSSRPTPAGRVPSAERIAYLEARLAAAGGTDLTRAK